MLSETDIIDLFKFRTSRKTGSGLLCGIGDDAALIAGPRKGTAYVVTQDLLAEGVHFRLDWISARDLAYKAIAVNLSDLAAMGATPRFLLLSLGLPKTLSDRWIKMFARHFLRVCEENGIVLIGGDTCAARRDLSIHVTAIGSVRTRSAVHRTGARAGDGIYTTGPLGASALGLLCLKRGMTSPLVKRHCRPPIRTAFAAALAQKGLASAMTDISDGLLLDLEALCGGELCAELVLGAIPIDAETRRAAKKLGIDPLPLVLGGGEDYELVFAVPERKEKALAAWCRRGDYTVYELGQLRRRSPRDRDAIVVCDENLKAISLRGIRRGYQCRT
jgi:thiamine-monophosphate kinase